MNLVFVIPKWSKFRVPETLVTFVIGDSLMQSGWSPQQTHWLYTISGFRVILTSLCFFMYPALAFIRVWHMHYTSVSNVYQQWIPGLFQEGQYSAYFWRKCLAFRWIFVVSVPINPTQDSSLAYWDSWYFGIDTANYANAISEWVQYPVGICSFHYVALQIVKIAYHCLLYGITTYFSNETTEITKTGKVKWSAHLPSFGRQ